MAPSPAVPVTVPTAILNGYKVVGRDPEFSADGLWVAFSAAPTNLTNGPDLFVWKVGQGRAQAVTTAHADLFSGWFGTQILVSELSSVPSLPAVGASSSDSATPASSDSGSPSASSTAATSVPTLTAPSGPATTSYLFDPATQDAQRIDRSMLLPVADPTRTFLIYWSGTIEVDAASGQLKAGKGNLYLDTWANLKLEPVSLDGIVPVPTASATSASQEPSASPSASPSPSPSPSPEATASPETSASPTPTPEPSASPVLPELLQVAASNSVESWVVDWDATGDHVAVWVADSASRSVGVVNLFSIDRGSGRIATDGPLFHARGLPSIQFDNGRLVYTTPAEGSDGKTFLVQIPPTPSSASPSPTASETPSATDGPGS